MIQTFRLAMEEKLKSQIDKHINDKIKGRKGTVTIVYSDSISDTSKN